jgi:hypothetical protein
LKNVKGRALIGGSSRDDISEARGIWATEAAIEENELFALRIDRRNALEDHTRHRNSTAGEI